MHPLLKKVLDPPLGSYIDASYSQGLTARGLKFRGLAALVLKSRGFRFSGLRARGLTT